MQLSFTGHVGSNPTLSVKEAPPNVRKVQTGVTFILSTYPRILSDPIRQRYRKTTSTFASIRQADSTMVEQRKFPGDAKS